MFVIILLFTEAVTEQDIGVLLEIDVVSQFSVSTLILHEWPVSSQNLVCSVRLNLFATSRTMMSLKSHLPQTGVISHYTSKLNANAGEENYKQNLAVLITLVVPWLLQITYQIYRVVLYLTLVEQYLGNDKTLAG